ncbi:MAG: hypothetical protein KKB59_20115 [Spirochaetes bacterium]|nr:hypothetical protein [Spirochaetota bacterium]
MSLVPTHTITFSVPQVAAEDAVSIFYLAFWDGTQNHVVISNGVQLISSITVFHGAQVGFTSLQLKNNYWPEMTPLNFGLEIYKGAIGQDPLTMPWFQGAQGSDIGIQTWSPTTLVDWYATEDNDIYIVAGYYP